MSSLPLYFADRSTVDWQWYTSVHKCYSFTHVLPAASLILADHECATFNPKAVRRDHSTENLLVDLRQLLAQATTIASADATVNSEVATVDVETANTEAATDDADAIVLADDTTMITEATTNAVAVGGSGMAEPYDSTLLEFVRYIADESFQTNRLLFCRVEGMLEQTFLQQQHKIFEQLKQRNDLLSTKLAQQYKQRPQKTLQDYHHQHLHHLHSDELKLPLRHDDFEIPPLFADLSIRTTSLSHAVDGFAFNEPGGNEAARNSAKQLDDVASKIVASLKCFNDTYKLDDLAPFLRLLCDTFKDDNFSIYVPPSQPLTSLVLAFGRMLARCRFLFLEALEFPHLKLCLLPSRRSIMHRLRITAVLLKDLDDQFQQMYEEVGYFDDQADYDRYRRSCNRLARKYAQATLSRGVRCSGDNAYDANNADDGQNEDTCKASRKSQGTADGRHSSLSYRDRDESDDDKVDNNVYTLGSRVAKNKSKTANASNGNDHDHNDANNDAIVDDDDDDDDVDDNEYSGDADMKYNSLVRQLIIRCIHILLDLLRISPNP